MTTSTLKQNEYTANNPTGSTAFEEWAGDVDSASPRVLIALSDPNLTRNDEWTPTTDLRTGLNIEVRRAACGGGCRCAVEVRVISG